VFEACIVPSAVVYRMLLKALWESVRAQSFAQKNAQVGIQASVGFQVSISGVPGGNLFFPLLAPRPSARPRHLSAFDQQLFPSAARVALPYCQPDEQPFSLHRRHMSQFKSL